MKISLDRLRAVLNYDGDTGIFTWKDDGPRSGTIAGHPSGDYVCICICNCNRGAHQWAWFYTFGVWPTTDIDHINGDPSDNRITNLRPATKAQNQHNRNRLMRTNTSGFMGVSFDPSRNKYRATIKADGRYRSLGRFDTADGASAAYLDAKARLHPFWVCPPAWSAIGAPA